MLRRIASDAARRHRRWPPPAAFAFSSHPARRTAAAAPLAVFLPDSANARARQRRSMSDNLLGHSPMAPRAPAQRRPPGAADTSPGSAGPSWGTDANVAGGGVWAQTSAKRDKLAELKLELDWSKGQRTLDDVATEEQRWDLFLADGIGLIARAADGVWESRKEREEGAGLDASGANGDAPKGGEDEVAAAAPGRPARLKPSTTSHPLLMELDKWLASMETKRGSDAELTKDHFDAYLSEAIRILSPGMGDAVQPGPLDALRQVRDFMEYDPDPDAAQEGQSQYVPPPEVDADLRSAEEPFDACAAHLRLLLARSAADHLRSSWDDLTAVTDADVDRAAVEGEVVERRTALPLRAVNAALRSYAFGDCSDRVAALWDLADWDGDGLLDQAEMDAVIWSSMKPVESALRELFVECVEAAGVRDAPPTWDDAQGARAQTAAAPPPPKKGWRQRRRESKEKKRLLKTFERTLANHFDVEVETPHRLRCIYAWADKSHQDGKIDSVLVDSGTIAGRKRYVELQPKISLAEFTDVQREHFPHIDRVGEELVSSFREDLLVQQGKGRQNRQLRRDCFLFLAGVSLIDAGILML